MTSRQVERKPTVKYRLKFLPDAWREWQALDGSIKLVLKPLLVKRLQNPHVLGALLHWELAGYYKINLLKQNYSLIYMVEDDQLVVLVLSLGKRANSATYSLAKKRIK